MVRARRCRSWPASCAMIAPHAGRNAALPIESTVRPIVIPANPGKKKNNTEEIVLAIPRTVMTNLRLTLSDIQPKTGPEMTIAKTEMP